MSLFSETPKELFFSKQDTEDIRLGDLFKPAVSISDISENSFCLLGYPDDEGISLNGGRVGASKGPDKIRQFLYKMTPTLSSKNYFDLGNLISENKSLSERHQIGQNTVHALLTKNVKTLSLGGGHDYGYSDASGFLKKFAGTGIKPIVLNFDAHLDVRPTTKGLNSGTPFYRLLTDYEGQFDFAEIGIQPQCNSLKHRNWALSKNAHIFNLKDILKTNGLMSLYAHSLFQKLTKDTPVFLSFDIDCLTSSEAPGCSQSWVTGLNTADFLIFFQKLKASCNLSGLGIYEVSPPLDLQDQTSKTAALIAYHFLFEDNL